MCYDTGYLYDIIGVCPDICRNIGMFISFTAFTIYVASMSILFFWLGYDIGKDREIQRRYRKQYKDEYK